MTIAEPRNIYDELGAKWVVNGLGNYTMLGGSTPSARVRAAMEAANNRYVVMEDLLDKTGKLIAEMLGAEAAYITTGAAGALALGMAACITGSDREKMARLPDTAGMKHELLLQRRQHYTYERCPTIVGARLVEVGDEAGTTVRQLEEAITPLTAAILYHAAAEGREGCLSLKQVIQIAKEPGVPILVDAASQIYPIERMRSYPASGADLICYAAKYFGAPQSTGILCGKREMVEAASAQGFIGFESGDHKAFGRPLKLDRQEIVGVVEALREWIEMDHDARLRGLDRRARSIVEALRGIPGLTAIAEPGSQSFAVRVRIAIDPSITGRAASAVMMALREGKPSIWLNSNADSLIIFIGTLTEGDDELVAARLREVMAQ